MSYEWKENITDAILISIFTAYAYFISYIYQLGYYEYFKLPSFLVEISIMNILNSTFSILAFIIFIYIIVTGIMSCIPNNTDVYIAKIIEKYIYISTLYIVLFMVADVKRKEFYYIYTVIALLIIFLDFVDPLFSQKEIKGYLKKVISQKKKESIKKLDIEKEKIHLEESGHRSKHKNSLDRFISNHIPVLPLLVIILIVTSYFSYAIGHFNARNKSTYTLLDGDKAILGTYDNNLIIRKINIQKKTFEPDFYLVSDQEGHRYIKENVGTLKPE